MKIEIIVATGEAERGELADAGPLSARLRTGGVRFVPPETTLEEVLAPAETATLEVGSEEAALHWRDRIRETRHEVVGEYARG